MEVLAQYRPKCVDVAGGQTMSTDEMVLVGETCQVLHIAIPYNEAFVEAVRGYQERFKPQHTVVHSTVPVGTCASLGAVHSPVRGIHPHLAQGIRTFIKYLGGPGASGVADYFRRAGLRVCLFDRADTTEALKLFDTEYYRTCIAFAHRVKEYCDKQGLNFSEVYRVANESYNEGYRLLGHGEYARPVLEPIQGAIGGHCVLPNQKLIALSE